MSAENILYKLHDGQITIYMPPDSRVGDELEAIKLSDPIEEWGILEGDICIVYHTDDVQKGDLVFIWTKGDLQYIGELDYDDYYYHLAEHGEYEGLSFHRSQARIIGRVIEVRRDGIPVDVPNLRPMHPMGTVLDLAAHREQLPRVDEPGLPDQPATIHRIEDYRQKGGAQ